MYVGEIPTSALIPPIAAPVHPLSSSPKMIGKSHVMLQLCLFLTMYHYVHAQNMRFSLQVYKTENDTNPIDARVYTSNTCSNMVLVGTMFELRTDHKFLENMVYNCTNACSDCIYSREIVFGHVFRLFEDQNVSICLEEESSIPVPSPMQCPRHDTGGSGPFWVFIGVGIAILSGALSIYFAHRCYARRHHVEQARETSSDASTRSETLSSEGVAELHDE